MDSHIEPMPEWAVYSIGVVSLIITLVVVVFAGHFDRPGHSGATLPPICHRLGVHHVRPSCARSYTHATARPARPQAALW